MTRSAPTPFFLSSLHLLAISLLVAGSVAGQTAAARPDRGVMPNGSYSVADIENISLQNGNVNLEIPLAALPPIAGGKLSWTIKAHYNSKLWDLTRTQLDADDDEWQPYIVDNPQLSQRGGWRISGQYTIEVRPASWDFDYAMPPLGAIPYHENQLLVNYNWYKVVLIMPDGAEHELRPVDHSAQADGTGLTFLHGYNSESPYTQSAMRYYSFDGSYLYATINTNATSWTVYLPDGTKVVQTTDGIQRVQDTNGNKIKIYSDTNGTHYQDEQTGREIRHGADGKIWYQTVGGVSKSIDIVWGATTVQGQVYKVNDWIPFQLNPRPCERNSEINVEIQVIREIILPPTEPAEEQRRFTFSYNSDTTESATNSVRWSCYTSLEEYTRTASKGWGSLSRILTPSGAVIDYAYKLDSGPFAHLPSFTEHIAEESITQKKLTHDGAIDVWTYAVLTDSATVTAPDGSIVDETKYSHSLGDGYVYGKAGLVYRSTRPFVRVDRHWSELIFSGASNSSPGGVVSFNPVVDAEYTTMLDAAGNQLKMSARTHQFDYNGNVTQTTEYDWFDPALVSRDAHGVPTGVPGSATVLRVVNNSYHNAATSSTFGNVYAKRSLSTGTPLVLSGLQQTSMGPAITQLSYDGQSYGVAPTVGNLTSQSVWDDLDSKWITSSQTYGAYGNLATKTDALGKVTQFHYDDSTHALPNRVVVDPQNGTGTQTTTTAFDYSTGLVISQTDANLIVSTIDYTNQLLGAVDPFGRPGIIKGPLVNGQQHWVTTKYVDRLRQVIQASDLTSQNDQLLKTKTTSDELGRVILSEQTEDGTNYSISARNVYEQMGKISYSSNPMRSAVPASTDGWTRSTRDTAGRVIEVATFSGAAQPSASPASQIPQWTGSVSTGYDAQFTTVTDQAGKSRRSMIDALGRLVRLDEPIAGNNLGSTTSPTQPTSYTYSVLGNLLTVTQGVQTRTFTYDSLSRLRTAANPESGTISYQYDDNGNLLVKTDARGVSAHYAYDALNRAGRRWYNGSSLLTSTTNNSPALPTGVGATDEVKYFYDTQTLPAGAPTFDRGYATGRLVGVTYGTGSAGTYRGYDARGAVLRQYQQTDAVNYLAEAVYSLSGSMQSQTYPSVPGAGDRRTVSYTNDNAGRLASVNSAATSYAPAASVSSIGYSAPGGLSSETYGNNLIHGVTYNSRLQANEIKLGTSGAPASNVSITYNYGTTANNGNLQSTSYAGGGLSYTQTFGYDELNRLTTSQEGASWSQTNSYDKYGNRSIVGGGLSFTASSNRITGWSYDAAGNLLNDGAHAYTFDAENKISKVDGISAYVYDGDGQRIRKLVNENLRFIYGVGGLQIAEFDGSSGALKKEYVYGANGLLSTIEPTAVNANGTRYTTSDHLGSPRLVTSSVAGVVSRHDYMPFGEELFNGGRTVGMGYGTTDGIRQKFTSKERDNETGLDFFGARYYGSTQGRFTSADDFLNDTSPVDPASWNLYVYVRNNPLRYIDPNGEKIYSGDVTGADRDELLRRANFTYGCESCVSVDKDGFLAVNTTGLSQDVLKATAFLTDAINSNDASKIFSVQVTNNNSDVGFGDSQRGSAGVQLPGNNFRTSAIRIRLDFGDDKRVIGDKGAKDAFLNLVFAHEVKHFYPNYIEDPSDGRQTGPVVDAINEIQQARGLLLRAEYGATKRTSGGEFVSLNFGKARTDRSGNIVRNRAGGIEVNRTNKVVTWQKRSVGGKGIN